MTQTSYQAEENQNITLDWTFSTRTDTNFRSISTICQMFTEGRYSVLFHLHQGAESPESQDPEFAGRVQWDKDVLTEGRLTLHVSRLRTSDSGFYECEILVRPDGTNSRRCWLNMTHWEMFLTQRRNKPETPNTERNKPETPNTEETNLRLPTQKETNLRLPTQEETNLRLPTQKDREGFGLFVFALVSVLLTLIGCVLLNFRRQAASEQGSDSGTVDRNGSEVSVCSGAEGPLQGDVLVLLCLIGSLSHIHYKCSCGGDTEGLFKLQLCSCGGDTEGLFKLQLCSCGGDTERLFKLQLCSCGGDTEGLFKLQLCSCGGDTEGLFKLQLCSCGGDTEGLFKLQLCLLSSGLTLQNKVDDFIFGISRKKHFTIN
ncbi:hypothetical protein F7725_004870 [Dissostichus mawsoni]|uniref:Immunoglobulin V-set domain-containing protein n=1 Tax=Dissostichus mawsoni TaxID=36200 RepID=A0A7J5XK01_DISMA|nr:hypothetical protein F7725_004870 [Dissostichus mawsoni]